MKKFFLIVIFNLFFANNLYAQNIQGNQPYIPPPPPIPNQPQNNQIQPNQQPQIASPIVNPQQQSMEPELEGIRQTLRELQSYVQSLNSGGIINLLSPNLPQNNKNKLSQEIQQAFTDIEGTLIYSLITEINTSNIQQLAQNKIRITTLQTVNVQKSSSHFQATIPCYFTLEKVVSNVGSKWYLYDTNFHNFLSGDTALKFLGGCGAIAAGSCCFGVVIIAVVIWLIVRSMRKR